VAQGDELSAGSLDDAAPRAAQTTRVRREIRELFGWIAVWFGVPFALPAFIIYVLLLGSSPINFFVVVLLAITPLVTTFVATRWALRAWGRLVACAVGLWSLTLSSGVLMLVLLAGGVVHV